MAKLPGTELFCTREPHMAGEGCLAPKNRKLMFLSVLKASHTGRTR
jgi:hypothetical protein